MPIGSWIILKRIIEKQNGRLWTGFMWLRIRTSGFCEHGNEKSSSIRVVFID
jgi:hypothetical protein